jgi:hypothetical protein
MTSPMDDTTLTRFMIIHYQAVLKTPLDDAARTTAQQLLAKAEAELAAAEQARDRIFKQRRVDLPTARRREPARPPQ